MNTEANQPNTTALKPWMNEDGLPRTDEEIREACKSWNADMWEEYLQNFESSQREDLFSDPSIINEISALLHK